MAVITISVWCSTSNLVSHVKRNLPKNGSNYRIVGSDDKEVLAAPECCMFWILRLSSNTSRSKTMDAHRVLSMLGVSDLRHTLVCIEKNTLHNEFAVNLEYGIAGYTSEILKLFLFREFNFMSCWMRIRTAAVLKIMSKTFRARCLNLFSDRPHFHSHKLSRVTQLFELIHGHTIIWTYLSAAPRTTKKVSESPDPSTLLNNKTKAVHNLFQPILRRMKLEGCCHHPHCIGFEF